MTPAKETPSSSSHSEPVQTTQASLQSLIATITDKLGGGPVDNISLSRSDALLVLQHLSSIKTKTETSPTTPKSEDVTKDLGKYKGYARLGDYAGKVFNDLKNEAKDHNRAMPFDCEEWANALRIGSAGDARMISLVQSFEFAADILLDKHDLSIQAARVAVRLYSLRNGLLHSKAGLLKMSRNWADLPKQVNKDLHELPSFLPPKFVGKELELRELISYFGDRCADLQEAETKAAAEALLPLKELNIHSNSDSDESSENPSTDDIFETQPVVQGSTSPKHGASEPLDDEPPHKKAKKAEASGVKTSGPFEEALENLRERAVGFVSLHHDSCLSAIADASKLIGEKQNQWLKTEKKEKKKAKKEAKKNSM